MTESFVEILKLFIFAVLFIFPPLKTLPIPQNTNGTMIIATNMVANLPLEKLLNLFSIKNVYLLNYKKQTYKLNCS